MTQSAAAPIAAREPPKREAFEAIAAELEREEAFGHQTAAVGAGQQDRHSESRAALPGVCLSLDPTAPFPSSDSRPALDGG
jgi:hypothetical protein